MKIEKIRVFKCKFNISFVEENREIGKDFLNLLLNCIIEIYIDKYF